MFAESQSSILQIGLLLFLILLVARLEFKGEEHVRLKPRHVMIDNQMQLRCLPVPSIVRLQLALTPQLVLAAALHRLPGCSGE